MPGQEVGCAAPPDEEVGCAAPLVEPCAAGCAMCVNGKAECGHGHFSATGWERGPFWLELAI